MAAADGATLGTFISLMLGDVVVMNVIFRKKLKMNLWYYYKGLAKGILPCIAIAAIVGFVAGYFLKNGGWTYLCVELAVICLIYGLCMLLFGMNTYEKNLVRSVLRKFTHGRDK